MKKGERGKDLEVYVAKEGSASCVTCLSSAADMRRLVVVMQRYSRCIFRGKCLCRVARVSVSTCSSTSRGSGYIRTTNLDF